MIQIPSGWDKITLNRLCDKIGSGSTPRGGSSVYKDNGMSFIRSQNVLDYKFSSNGLVFIDEIQALKLKNVEVFENDVLINITGDSVARVCKAPKEYLPAYVNQHVSILRANDTVLNGDYLKYYLLNLKTKKELLVLANTGGTRNALTKSNLEMLEITLPTLPEQEAIANVLLSLDNKRKLLDEENKTLDEVIQIMYKEWFVNFNYPEATGQMIDSDLGKIPIRWKIDGVKHLVTHIKENIKPYENEEIDYNHYSIPAFDNDKIPDLVKGKEIGSNKYRVIDKSFLISKLNPSTQRVWTIFNSKSNSICSTEFQVLKPKSFKNFGFIYSALTSYQLKTKLAGRAHGTSSSHQRVKPEDILGIKIIIPEQAVMEQFSKLANEILEKIDVNLLQIESLVSIRNSILSRLMSGEIRVEEFGEIDG